MEAYVIPFKRQWVKVLSYGQSSAFCDHFAKTYRTGSDSIPVPTDWFLSPSPCSIIHLDVGDFMTRLSSKGHSSLR